MGRIRESDLSTEAPRFRRTLDLERRHPHYEANGEAVDFLWRSYLGGREYREAGLLDKYPREDNAVYDARCERAYLLNYYAAVIDAYVSAVYRRDPVREGGSSAAEEFQDDATGSGESLTRFMREQTTFSLAAGRSYSIVDVDPSGSPYVHAVHPANLLDFARDRDGEFLWALIAENRVEESDPYVSRVEEQLFRLWTREEWILFDRDGNAVESDANRARVVPLLIMDADEVNLPTYDIALVMKRIYNLCSQLDEILINVTFPQMYLPGEGVAERDGEAISDDVAPIAIGTSRTLLIPDGATMTPGFLAPPDGPARLHIEERERLIGAVYSLAGLERRDPDSQNVQSGVAKAYDFRETNARLVSLAQLAERTELQIFDLVNAYGVSGEVNVSYQKDFNVRDVQAMIDNFEKVQDLSLPAEAKRRGATDLSLALAEEATEEEKQAIRQAAENMPDSAFGGQTQTPLSDLFASGLGSALGANAQEAEDA